MAAESAYLISLLQVHFMQVSQRAQNEESRLKRTATKCGTWWLSWLRLHCGQSLRMSFFLQCQMTTLSLPPDCLLTLNSFSATSWRRWFCPNLMSSSVRHSGSSRLSITLVSEYMTLIAWADNFLLCLSSCRDKPSKLGNRFWYSGCASKSLYHNTNTDNNMQQTWHHTSRQRSNMFTNTNFCTNLHKYS